jgi:hypothetical protein
LNPESCDELCTGTPRGWSPPTGDVTGTEPGAR